MDDHTFDRLTRSLSGSSPRRQVLRWVSGLLAGSVAGASRLQEAAAACTRQPGERCRDDAQCCNESGQDGGICLKTGRRKKCRCDDGRPTCGGDCCPAGSTCEGRRENKHCSAAPPECTDSDLSQCPDPTNQCQKVVCTGGVCDFAADAGKSCDTGNPCTIGATCNAQGVCGGGTTKTCTTPPNTQCFQPTGTCNTTSGDCEYIVTEDAPCDTGNPCTTGATCNAQGVCGGGTTKVCPVRETCCPAGSTTCTPLECCRLNGVICQAHNDCCSNNCTGGSNKTCQP